MLGANFLKDDNSNFELFPLTPATFSTFVRNRSYALGTNKLETNLDEKTFGLENKHLLFLNCMTLIVQRCFYQKNDIKRTINDPENYARPLNVRLVGPYAQSFS